MAIAYYITAHGLGHAIRSAVVLNAIPAEIPILVRSNVRPSLLREEIRRPFELLPAAFDCGAIQKDGFTVDPAATLQTYAGLAQENAARLADEIRLLKSHDVRAVATDIASFPLRVAAETGIPSVAIGNFTWVDIYRPFVNGSLEHRGLLEEMRNEYSLATHGLRLPLSCAMDGLNSPREVPLICRSSVRIRPALAGFLDLDPNDRWVLLYLGQYAVEFDWTRLATIPKTRFLMVGTEPAPPNVVMVDPTRFDVADVIASCDAALGKPGYGTVADCIAGKTPIVYALPSGFAESLAIDEELKNWGRGVRIDQATLFLGDLRPALDSAVATTSKKSFPVDGGQIAADLLTELHSSASTDSPERIRPER